MTIKQLVQSAAAAGLLMAGPALALAGGAAGQTYAGIGYGFTTYDEDGFEEADMGVLVGRFGHYFFDNLAVEGRAGFGVDDDTIGNVEVEVDNMFGVYGLGHLPIGRNASIYGMVGFTSGEITATGPGGTFSEDDTDISFGVGADIGLNRNTDINVEYTQYLDESDYDVTALGVGVSFKF